MKRKTPLRQKTGLKARTRLSSKTRLRQTKRMKAKAAAGSLPYLKSEHQRLFNVLVKLSYTNKYGMCQCYTCGTGMQYTDAHAGHYYHTQAHPAVCTDIRNVRVQCYHCNINLAGNLAVYRQKLIEELGEDEFADLTQKAKASINKRTRHELQEEILTMQELIRSKESKL